MEKTELTKKQQKAIDKLNKKLADLNGQAKIKEIQDKINKKKKEIYGNKKGLVDQIMEIITR